MKVLLLNQTFHPDIAATAQYLGRVAVSLAERGHEVRVVTSRRAYDQPGEQFARRESWRGVEIFRVGATGLGKSAKWKRLLDFASFFSSCGLKALTLPRADVVVALTSPPLISVVGAVMAGLKGSRFIYWIMDLNPDAAIAAGWLKDRSVMARSLQAISLFSLRRAHKIVVLDSFARDRIVAKGISADKIVVIPPWSQDESIHFDPAGREQFRQANGLADKFVVMYSGNHSPCHPLDTLLGAAKALEKEGRIRFCFVGGGSEFARVQKFAGENNLQNILCLPYRSSSELAASLSAADLHVVVMGNPYVGIIHPCKIYNILAVGAPVLYIGPEPSHVTQILHELQTQHPARSVRHGDVKGAIAAIRSWPSSERPVPGAAREPLSQATSQAVLLPQLVGLIEIEGSK
jgi:glycosyltransferase involved in cell wall biosynthesis